MGFHVNEGKTKYLVGSRRPSNKDFVEVDNCLNLFEKVDDFK